MSLPNYYQILGVDPSVDQASLKKAYRQMAMRFHPDVNASPDAQQRFALINQAYNVLSDPEKRRRYDLQLSRPKVVRNTDARSQAGGSPFQENPNAQRARVFQQMYWAQMARDPAKVSPEERQKQFAQGLVTAFVMVFFVLFSGGTLVTLVYFSLNIFWGIELGKQRGVGVLIQFSVPLAFFLFYRVALRLIEKAWAQNYIRRLAAFAQKSGLLNAND